MTKKQMKQIVLDNLNDYLPCDKQWEIREAIMEKDNDGYVDSISVSCDDRVARVLRVDVLYDQYCQGASIEHILKNAAKQLADVLPECVSIAMDNILNFQTIKDNIFAYVLNTKMNRLRLAEMPHRNVEDLSIAYRVLIDSDEESNATIAIGNKLMATWEINEETLYKLAVKNTKRLFPVSVRGMFETLSDTIGMVGDICTNDVLNRSDENMYVISNTQGVRGAIYMFDIETLYRIAKRFNTARVCLFPSSIHEILACDFERINLAEANVMVVEINTEMVHKEEVLSDHTYLFDTTTMTITSL